MTTAFPSSFPLDELYYFFNFYCCCCLSSSRGWSVCMVSSERDERETRDERDSREIPSCGGSEQR
jgi:hypothetical protein